MPQEHGRSAPAVDAAANEIQDTSLLGIQEHIASLLHQYPQAVTEVVALPTKDGQPVISRDIWISEHLKRILRDINAPWISGILKECHNSNTCHAMRVGEDTYMCRAHNDGRLCTAREYISHTIDAASEQLQSTKPISTSEDMRLPRPSHQLFSLVCKQLARIFSHIYLHHHDLFQRCEETTSLYARFKKLTKTFNLMPDGLLLM